MPRILGVNIPDNKRIVIALTYVHGVGPALSRKLLKAAKIDENKKASSLTPEELNKIRAIAEKDYKTEGELRRETLTSIRRLRDIGSWRGMRHSKRLPVRGQRTKTNNRTVRGNVRKTVGSGKRPAATPT
ncbi:MAG: 30S ribosomal protein S13 [Patescibacteria group bacterium]|nr:30S ribosomal protein S13 [Patescibacteria group bacterium]